MQRLIAALALALAAAVAGTTALAASATPNPRVSYGSIRGGSFEKPNPRVYGGTGGGRAARPRPPRAAHAGLGRHVATWGRGISPVVDCSSASQTIRLTASATSMDGYDPQWVAAQFYVYNNDTGTGFFAPAQNDWFIFQTVYNNGASSPGSKTVSYTVAKGHYQVAVRYYWWTGSAWMNPTGWLGTNSYTWYGPWATLDRPTCPVGLSS